MCVKVIQPTSNPLHGMERGIYKLQPLARVLGDSFGLMGRPNGLCPIGFGPGYLLSNRIPDYELSSIYFRRDRSFSIHLWNPNKFDSPN